MDKLNEEFKSVWKNISAIFKFLMALSLTALYIKLILTKAPDALTSPANVLLFFIAGLYTAWQALQGYWQIKDIQYNYIALKHLLHPLSADHTFIRTLYLAMTSDFDPLSEAYEAKLLDDKAEAEAELEKAEEQLQATLAYQQYMSDSFKSNIKTWNKWQAFCQGRVQVAIDLDISFIQTH